MLTTILDRVGLHADRTLISDAGGAYTGRQLLGTAAQVAARLGTGPAPVERVALLASPGFAYVAGLLAIWQRGAMAVPLCPEHPPAEMAYVLADSGVSGIVADSALAPLLDAVERDPAIVVVPVPATPLAGSSASPAAVTLTADTPAMMLYTSGTTGRPKGVVHTHATLTAQITCLVEAWEWTPDDRIPHFLPLHHTHGIVNKLLCSLWAGARCDMFPRFDAATIFERIATPEPGAPPYTVFMAVPTIYAKAITAWEAADETTRARWSAGFARLRLMVSGSAALAVPILEQWRTISGHVLLERYGMTEIGMALTNPLHGERRPGFVGLPVPGMEVRLADEDGTALSVDPSRPDEPVAGELQVRGANVFVGYWRRPDETASSFTADGWFRTGDQVVLEDGAYRIAGRLSTDIIKSGGYKISALEIEAVLVDHPAIAEVAVIGVPDDTWGERIAAAVVLRPGSSLTLDEARDWARSRLAPYKLPTLWRVVDELPRNVMGKVLKPATKTLF